MQPFSFHLFASGLYVASMSEPISVETSLVVSGGNLKEPALLKFETIQGTNVIKLAKTCRTLAKVAEQFSNRCRTLFADVDVFIFLQEFRNECVDNVIKARARSDDPMADDLPEDGGESGGPGKTRTELFNDLKIPELIEVKLPAFVSKSGHVQEEITTMMLATPKKSASVWVEATGPNLTWFKHACNKAWTEPPCNKRKLDESLEFPDVQWPDCVSVILNDSKTIRVSCNYKADSGKWTKFTRGVSKTNYISSQDLSAAIDSMVKTVSKFYADNHCQPERSADGSPAKAGPYD